MTLTPRILLVDDDPNDVAIAQLAFEWSGLHEDLAVAHDGLDALEYLRRTGTHQHRPVGSPHLVLLDLNMPRVDGFDVLRTVRHDDALVHIPIVVFTTSDAQRDRVRCNDLGADDYLIKPSGIEQFLTIIGDLTSRWLRDDSVAM
ncbi:response regulator [Deinococcus sp.]|uniref:response regulator n=1 Tax=Deinococcus sp. TaxID=47478 RepID=UPI002869BE1A|nr:response regulator [Deinococcus sp.]